MLGLNNNRRWEALSRLAALCDALASERGVERYKILQKKTMQAIVEAMPATMDELMLIKGIGPKKAAQFGARILAAVNGSEVSEQPRKRESLAEQKERIFSVADFLDRLNDVLAGEIATVRGEVVGFQSHPTGAYFSLKDKKGDSVLQCYMSPYIYRGLGTLLEDGMEVQVTGRPEIYKPKGRFSFVVTHLTLSGEGTLKKAYELLKKKLAAEGLFDRKRPLPEFIERVGIITSRTGAVIGDFKKNIASRGFGLSLYDVRVEGGKAAQEILAALQWFNEHADRFDALVIIRGGGSLEDLQAFNNEAVARAVFASKIPTICGIGHDRDLPIVSLVGDREVSTPSIAAVTVNRSWDRLREGVPLYEEQLLSGFARLMRARGVYIEHATQKLTGVFVKIFGEFRMLTKALREGFSRMVDKYRESLVHYERYLMMADPERTLRLGYGIVFDERGRVVRDAAEAKPGDRISAKLYKGTLKAKVEEQIMEHGPRQK